MWVWGPELGGCKLKCHFLPDFFRFLLAEDKGGMNGLGVSIPE